MNWRPQRTSCRCRSFNRTPLATISVVAKELKKEIGKDKEFKDIDLLTSQTKRCSEILKQISKNK